MLRITNTTRAEGLTVVLEGRLAGPWVDELARCWSALTTTQNADSICVELDGVTFIDAAERALLRTIHEEGASLVAFGCMTCAVSGGDQAALVDRCSFVEVCHDTRRTFS